MIVILQRGGLEGNGATIRMKRLLLLPMDGVASLGCTVAESIDTNWEGGGRCRVSLVGCTGNFPASVGLGTIVPRS